MNKIYYTVELILEQISDNIQEYTGYRNIYLYNIENNIPIKIGEILSKSQALMLDITTEEEISDFIDEFVPEIDTNKIQFIQL